MISVSKVLNVLNKPALVGWANRQGLKGIDTSVYMNNKSNKGTSIHDKINNFLMGDATVEPHKGFMKWYEAHEVEPLLMEHSVQAYGLTGRVDLYADVNGKKYVLDFKTSKGIYPDMFHQLAAYKYMLQDNGYEVDRVAIIRLYDEDYESKIKEDVSLNWEIVKHCLEIYKLKEAL